MWSTQTSKIIQWNSFGLDNLFYKYDVSSTRDRKRISFILGGSALGTLRNKRVLLKRAYTLPTKAGWIIHPPAAEHGSYLYDISSTENWLPRKGNVLNYAEILPWNINLLRTRPETPFILRARRHDTNESIASWCTYQVLHFQRVQRVQNTFVCWVPRELDSKGGGRSRQFWHKEKQIFVFLFP